MGDEEGQGAECFTLVPDWLRHLFADWLKAHCKRLQQFTEGEKFTGIFNEWKRTRKSLADERSSYSHNKYHKTNY